VTVEVARASLSDVLRAADRKVSIEEIQRRVPTTTPSAWPTSWGSGA
jgi:hypothetical protein